MEDRVFHSPYLTAWEMSEQPCGRWEHIQYAVHVKHHKSITLYAARLNSSGI